MKKWTAMVVCCLMVTLLAPLASAEMITMTPKYYDPANDIADWHLERRDISDELIQSLRKGSFWANLLPVSEDLLVWYGSFEYHDMVREESFWLSTDVEMPRTDAYAVAVDREGKRLWSLRLSDPQSENGFTSAHLLEDGRILLKFNDAIGEFGSQYYIVSQAGEVQEMLPAYKAKAYGVGEMLIPMHGGYFGGGMQYKDGALGQMFDEVNFTFFDDALEMRWRNESEAYRASFLTAHEASDGILLGGSIWLSYIPDQPYLNQTAQQIPIALKLDLDGNVIWTYMGHELSFGGAGALHETADGGAIFLTLNDPTVPTAYDDPGRATLVKLDSDGGLQWVRQIAEYELYGGAGFVPYGEGYLIGGYWLTEDDEMVNVVLYVSAEGALLGSALFDKGESSAAHYNAYTSLVSAPDGGAYLCGNTVESEGVLAGMDNPQHYRPFYVNMGDVFPVD